ncbi:MAG: B12-binding domain-containing radical SAM protein [Candidatus Bathyarchaeota archaeon]|nr:B12-binding domain-containing radical SAM protein [Candidatus Bathyarchaeota archaeon]
MKARVTLVNPPYPAGAVQAPFIPLGIGYLAAFLEKNDYEVNVIDCQVDYPSPKQLADKFAKTKPDLIGLTSATLTYKPALEIVKIAKEVCPNCLTVMGGPHVTVLDEQTMVEPNAPDVVARGEGEQTLLELAELSSEPALGKLGKVNGITFKKNGKLVRTKDREFIQNLDELSHPAYDHFDLRGYKFSGKMYLPIITSRGCPFNCAFCLASQMCGRGFRARSPKKVVDELEWLRDEHGADAYAFYDDTFTFDKQRAFDICQEIIDRKVDLPWDCRTRVDQVTVEMLQKMKRANCKLIHYGVESGSQKMLNLMRKGTTVKQNARAIKLTKEIGIGAAISVVVGYPGETPEMLQQTVEFMEKTKPDYVYMCQAIPYPGTEMAAQLEKLGWTMDPDWNHYDEVTPVFKSPLLSQENIDRTRKEYFNRFFSPTYYVRESMRGDFYSKIMARTALNHLLWRSKVPQLISTVMGRSGSKKEE